MFKRIALVSMFALVLVPAAASADGTVSLGVFTPVQMVSQTESVEAFRLSLLYGENVDMRGLDLSLIGMNTGNVAGVAFTGVGIVEGNFTGWQNGWLASITEGNMQGLQVGAYNSSGLGSSGVQWGLVNTSDDFSGLQFGATYAGPYYDAEVTSSRKVLNILEISASHTTGAELVDGYLPQHRKYTTDLTRGLMNSYYLGCTQTSDTTTDGAEPVEVFVTNPNVLKVSKIGRDAAEPILEVD